MSEPTVERAPQPSRQEDSVRAYLKGKESNDLVFAVTGHIGSGCTWVASALSEQLRQARFQPKQIKLSEVIATLTGIRRTNDHSTSITMDLQKRGDNLRRSYGSSIIAGLAIREIREHRRNPNATANAFVLDSLKNPEEVEVLRTVYGSSFYLIGVLANDDTRFGRLLLKYKSDDLTAEEKHRRIRKVMADDEAGNEDFEQHVRKTIKLSDFFIANEGVGNDLGTDLKRFIDAITRAKITRPTSHEKGMHAAWAAALKSSCLSRQVGAAILTPSGELLAVGTNDPPAYGGGVYGDGDIERDYRCFKYPDPAYSTEGFCRNAKVKSEIYDEIHRAMVSHGLLSAAASPDKIRRAVGETRIKDLIEFSRAVHAEMDALLSLPRNGITLPPNSTLFCTTYPCHSCARHIVAVGIRTVIYIEPYPKSKALDLHGDAISSVSVATEPDQQHLKVEFRLFTGVAPRAYSALFEKRGEVKDPHTGKLITIRFPSPKHGSPMLTGSFLELEENVAQKVASLLGKDGSDGR